LYYYKSSLFSLFGRFKKIATIDSKTPKPEKREQGTVAVTSLIGASHNMHTHLASSYELILEPILLTSIFSFSLSSSSS